MSTQRLIDKLTSWPVTLTVCLLIVLGTLTVKLWPRTVPFDQCSVAYQTYANQPGIRAAFIKDYKVNDTVFVDATLLEATDSNVWEVLCKDFDIVSFKLYPEEYRKKMTSSNSYSVRVIRDTIKDGKDIYYMRDVIIYSHPNRTMCIFNGMNEKQYDAIIENKTREITY